MSETSAQSSVHNYPDKLNDCLIVDDILKKKFEHEFKNVVEHKIHKSYKKFKAVVYKQEAGLPFYHIKYEVDNDTYIHATVTEIKDKFNQINSNS